MKLIVGLGNPGTQYEKTRHNVGFMAVDHLQQHYFFEEFRSLDKGKSLMTKGEIDGEKVILLKPTQFMNLSGIATAAVAQFFKIPRSDIIVIYDDVDIPTGQLRLRTDGSAGGHNGIKSLIEKLGGADFIRLRIGIKPEKSFPGELSDYVLGKFTEDEQAAANQVIDQLPSLIEFLLKEGVQKAMNQFN